MNSKDMLRYSEMAELNYEAQLMWQFFKLDHYILVKNNKLLVSLEEAAENEENSDWVGFVKTIKIFINKKLSVTNDRLDKMEAKMEAGQAKMEAGQAEIKASLKAIMTKLEEK